MSGYLCPKDQQPLQPYISFLAPTYETWICWRCGGIFYDLVDVGRLDEIKNEMIRNAEKKIDDKAIMKALEEGKQV